MALFIVSGGRALDGEITVGGSKNAVLPIIFATVAARGTSVIENVPDITDVDAALSIIEDLGAKIRRDGTTVFIDTENLRYKAPNPKLTSRLRASTYVLGASLARFHRIDACEFGGCNFEPRPIDLHLFAFSCLGASKTGKELTLTKRKPQDIKFSKPSVGATANALILSASRPYTVRIYGYAKEPHICALADFLVAAGAKIDFFDDYILVSGGELHGARVRIPEDPIECSTYLLASLMTGGRIRVKNPPIKELAPLLSLLLKGGVNIDTSDGTLALSGGLLSPISVSAAPYPEFPTDLQPLIAPVMGAFFGGEITDTVFPGRFGYLDDLRRFGLKYEYKDGKAKIFPSRLHSALASVPDLRGGAALVLAALKAEGTSVITSAQTVLRGYGGITEKLRTLGADITEIKD